ncbi:hypothetical protein D3C87_1751120 [compost metagenome]
MHQILTSVLFRPRGLLLAAAIGAISSVWISILEMHPEKLKRMLLCKFRKALIIGERWRPRVSINLTGDLAVVLGVFQVSGNFASVQIFSKFPSLISTMLM